LSQENIAELALPTSKKAVDHLHEHDFEAWQENMWCVAELDQEYIVIGLWAISKI
jgi:hypothetical protein